MPHTNLCTNLKHTVNRYHFLQDKFKSLCNDIFQNDRFIEDQVARANPSYVEYDYLNQLLHPFYRDKNFEVKEDHKDVDILIRYKYSTI
jgi:hypothetical protein